MSAFIESQRAAGFAVELVCRTLGVSRSAHYARQRAAPSVRAVRDAELIDTIRSLHKANFEAYGYRKMHLALTRAGVRDVGRDRVKRLMRTHGIQGAKRRGKPWRTTTPDPDAGRQPDLVQRDFTASRPDELYVADLTYLRCWEGLVFLAFVIDVYSRRVVGWQLAPHMRALAGLRRAADGRLDASARRRRRARAPLRPRIATRTQGVVATPGYWSASRSG